MKYAISRKSLFIHLCYVQVYAYFYEKSYRNAIIYGQWYSKFQKITNCGRPIYEKLNMFYSKQMDVVGKISKVNFLFYVVNSIGKLDVTNLNFDQKTRIFLLKILQECYNLLIVVFFTFLYLMVIFTYTLCISIYFNTFDISNEF